MDEREQMAAWNGTTTQYMCTIFSLVVLSKLSNAKNIFQEADGDQHNVFTSPQNECVCVCVHCFCACSPSKSRNSNTEVYSGTYITLHNVSKSHTFASPQHLVDVDFFFLSIQSVFLGVISVVFWAWKTICTLLGVE